MTSSSIVNIVFNNDEIDRSNNKDSVKYDYGTLNNVSDEEYLNNRSYLEYINAEGVFDVTRGEKPNGEKILVKHNCSAKVQKKRIPNLMEKNAQKKSRLTLNRLSLCAPSRT